MATNNKCGLFLEPHIIFLTSTCDIDWGTPTIIINIYLLFVGWSTLPFISLHFPLAIEKP
jgi:hypothetical protein